MPGSILYADSLDVENHWPVGVRVHCESGIPHGSNAIKFARTGEVSIELRIGCSDAPGTRIRCEVRDTGVGIPADRVESLSEPFSHSLLLRFRCKFGWSRQLLLDADRLLRARIWTMVTKRRTALKLSSSRIRREPNPTPATKKQTGKKPTPIRARTRTSIVGMTIYMPDIEPSARGRRLLEALERLKG